MVFGGSAELVTSKAPLDQGSQSNPSLQVFVDSYLSFDDMIFCKCDMERLDPVGYMSRGLQKGRTQ